MATEQLPQLFGIIPTGSSPIITPSFVPSSTSFIYTLPPRPFSHIAVFILPGITLPEGAAAAVYMQLPSSAPNTSTASSMNGPQPEPGKFKFLGGIGTGKESAIFKVAGLRGSAPVAGEVDMDADVPAAAPSVTIGISLEPAESVAAQMASVTSSSSSADSTSAASFSPSSQALVPFATPKQPPDATVLAQRIIKNAFNFLASFSGNLQNGVEVVPLRAFEEWWKRFEGRVRSDPGFLERDSGD